MEIETSTEQIISGCSRLERGVASTINLRHCGMKPDGGTAWQLGALYVHPSQFLGLVKTSTNTYLLI
jgi:hypothetical protein